jgi:hypothetical protein
MCTGIVGMSCRYYVVFLSSAHMWRRMVEEGGGRRNEVFGM